MLDSILHEPSLGTFLPPLGLEFNLLKTCQLPLNPKS